LLSAAAVSAAANVIFYFAVVVGPSAAFSRDLTRNLKSLALYLRESSPPDAVVAAADIGYLGFYSGRRVLDLGGLVDVETSALRDAYTYEEIVERGLYLDLPSRPRVDFLIDRDTSRERLDGRVIAGRRFDAVRTVEVSNLGIRKPGPYYFTLYRIERGDA